MWTVFFAAATVLCAAGWFIRYISCAALVWYLTKRNIPEPSPEEMKQGCLWAVSHLAEDFAGWMRKGR